jgi:class 3 adenylate cyclase
MVTELAGSAAIRARLAEDELDAFRREQDWTLRDVVEDAGGRVVKNTGDGLMLAFPSAGAALDAGVGMQQQLDRRNRTAAVAMRVRIGISMGDAFVEDGDYFGVPPVEAARLCAEAGDGEILVADPVRTVLRGQAGHRLEAAGARRLKGLPEPVLAWTVVRPPLPASAGPPLPPRLRGLADTPYVGRVAERRALRETWDQVVDGGQRQVVIVSGEAGIGKTRLVTHTAQTGLPDHAVVLYGRCDEDQEVPYHAWRELLRDYAQIAPRRILRPHAAELSRLVAGLADRLGPVPAPAPGDPETERYLLFAAVAGLLAAVAERAPVLLVLDDLHWADRPTLLLLKHLVAAPGTGRLMILATFRESDVGATDPLTGVLADLHREPGVARLDLPGLGRDDIAALVEDMTGQPIDSAGLALARDVHRDTAGNPFFAGELLRHLRETGAIARGADGRWSLAGALAGADLPQSVREVIERRVGRLTDEARRILCVGAVIGREFDLAVAARAAGVTPARALDLLDEATAAALVTTTVVTRPGFAGLDVAEIPAFAHGLVQATLYGGLPAGRRAMLHRAVGTAIEAECGGEVDGRLAELAHHFLAAAPAGDGDGERAVDYAVRAGEEAMREFAYDQAAALFARALAVPGAARGRRRIGLLQALGGAQMRSGDSQAARRTLLEAAAAARRHQEPEALARAVRSCEIWGLSLGVDDELVELAEAAVPLLEGWARPRLAAEVKGLLAAALYYGPAGDAPRRERLATEALATARAVHDAADDRESRQTLAYVLGRYLLARWGPDSSTRDFGLADELVDLSRQLGDVELELFAVNWRNTMLGELGEFAVLERELIRMEHLATTVRQPRAMVFLPLHRAMLALVAGRFADAERLNAESLEIGRRLAGSVSRLAAEAQMIMLRLQQGRLAELEPQVRTIAARYPELVAIRCALVVLLLQDGRDADARVEFDRLIGPGLGSVPRDHTQILVLALLAEAAADLRDVGRARSLYDWLLPYSRRWVVVANDTALWPVDRSLGRLAGLAGASELAWAHFAAARRAAEAAGAAPSLALLALDEARLVAACGEGPTDTADAARRAGEARRLAEHLGMRSVVRAAGRLESELAGVDPPAEARVAAGRAPPARAPGRSVGITSTMDL